MSGNTQTGGIGIVFPCGGQRANMQVYHPYIWPGGQSHTKCVAVRHSVTTWQLNTAQSPNVSKRQSMVWAEPPWGEGIQGHLTRSLVGALRMVSIDPNRVEPPVPLHSLLQLISRPSEQHRMVCWQDVYLPVTLDFISSLAWLCIGWEGCDGEEHWSSNTKPHQIRWQWTLSSHIYR